MKLCRHTASDSDIWPSKHGWLNLRHVLAQVNVDRQDNVRRAAKSSGRGGGNAPVRADPRDDYTVKEVIEIVERSGAHTWGSWKPTVAP